MRILVAGGAGYIGSHVVLALVDRGFEVVVVDNLVNGHADAMASADGVELFVGDIGDRKFMRRVFADNHIDVVMNFAGYAYVGESMDEPAKYYNNNVACLLCLLDEMVAAGVIRMVFSSSCATYGMHDECPIQESCPQNPVNPYGASKLMAERILADYDNAYGVKSIIFRYFNAAGADPQGRSGERHDPETHLIPLAFDAAMGRRKRLSVFGTDHPTPDGTCIRDYIHVADLAEAHVLGMDWLLDRKASYDFNLGVGRGFSVREVIEAVERSTMKKIPVMKGKRRAGDPPVLIADATRARRMLGWTPRYPDLDAIIGHAWQWHCQAFQ